MYTDIYIYTHIYIYIYNNIYVYNLEAAAAAADPLARLFVWWLMGVGQ